MIKITYEEYWNDFTRREHTKYLRSLQDLEGWIFGSMLGKFHMYFPIKADRIEWCPTGRYPDLWIHQVEDDDGILMSDGKYTDGEKFMADCIKTWCLHCRERQNERPKFVNK